MTLPPRNAVVTALQRREPGSRLQPLPGDASTRRFYRWEGSDSSRIVMDYGGPCAGCLDPAMTHLFQAAGLPVASILEIEFSLGFLVLEDLGPTMLEARVQPLGGHGPTPPELLLAAELAAQVATQGTPILDGSPRARRPALNASRFRFEMDFFLEHFVLGWLRGEVADEGSSFRPPAGLQPLRQSLFALAERAAADGRSVLCHRDFHSRNLMWTADRAESTSALAMVDIQDAQRGPRGYDLVSLLYDAYVDLAPAWQASMVEAYFRQLKQAGRSDWLSGLESRLPDLGAERMIKALGTFGFQVRRMGRPQFAEGVPRTLARLRGLLGSTAELRRLGDSLEAAGALETPDLAV